MIISSIKYFIQEIRKNVENNKKEFDKFFHCDAPLKHSFSNIVCYQFK